MKYYSRYINGVLHDELQECTFEQYQFAYKYLGSEYVKMIDENITDVFNALAGYFKPKF